MRAPRAPSPRPGAREEKDSAKDSARDSAKEPSEMDTSPRNVTSFAPAPAPEVTKAREPPLPMGRASPRDRDDFERAPVSARETSTHSSVKGGSPSVPPLLPTGHAIFDRDLGSPKDKSDSNNIATKRAESARMAPRRASTPRAGSPRAGSPRALPP
jgi:hypothetical protein